MSLNPHATTTMMAPATGPQTPGRFKSVDVVRVLREYLWLFVVMTVIGAIVGLITWGSLRVTMPRWTSTTYLEVTPMSDEPFTTGQDDMMGTKRDMLETLIQNEVMMIQSEGILSEAINRSIVQENTQWIKKFGTDMREAYEELIDDALSVSMIRNTSLINLSVTTPYEHDAKRIINAITMVYLRQKSDAVSLDSREVRNALQKELERSEDSTRRLSDQITQFAVQEDIETLDVSKSTAAAELAALSAQNSELTAYLASAMAAYQGLLAQQRTGQIEASPEAVQEVEQTGEVQRMILLENDLIQRLETTRRLLGNKHMASRQIEVSLEELRAQKKVVIDRNLRELEAARFQSAAKSIESMKSQLDGLAPKMEDATNRMIDLTGRLERYHKLVEEREMEWKKQMRLDEALADIRVTLERDKVNVKQRGAPTTAELTFPLIHYVIPIVACLTLLGTVGMVFLIESLDQRVRSPSDIKLMPETELLGLLPDATEDPSGEINIERIVERQPTGLIAEQFRHIRTAILNKMDRRGYKTLLIAGAQPNCGASSTIQNLAASFALNGRKALMIDANFRRPSLGRALGIEHGEGLVDLLRHDVSAGDIIQKVPDLDLWMLPAGHTEDAQPELLECPRFRSLLSELEAKYDLILIDTAPALLASESEILAQMVDSIVIIIRAGEDKRGMIERMIRNLDGQRGDLLGVILNGVRSSAGGYFKKNYKEFYRYRNGSTGNGKTADHDTTGLAVNRKAESPDPTMTRDKEDS